MGAAGAAVGLRFAGDALPGLVPGVEGELPVVVVEHADDAGLGDRWAHASAPVLLFERTFRDGRPFLRVEHDPSVGYRIAAVAHGAHLVSSDGTRCLSALPAERPWRALKLLAAQTLPLIATLRGREVLHAAGVVVEDRLIGIVAASGTGKSAIACNVLAQGGRFFADDVLALEVVDGAVCAHPGARLLNLYARDFEAIPESARPRLGAPLGASDKLHFQPPGFPAALPLCGLLFLRRDQDFRRTELASVEGAPARLLGNAFLPYLDRAERLQRQLDVASALAHTVPLAELRIAPGDRPPALAAVVRDWAMELRG